jgi:DNA-binding NtrC family response regulator
MATPNSERPLNALVVESDPDYAVSVKAIAEAASLGVTVAPEPEEGLRLLASERFDLVVLAVREQDDVAALVGEIHDAGFAAQPATRLGAGDRLEACGATAGKWPVKPTAERAATRCAEVVHAQERRRVLPRVVSSTGWQVAWHRGGLLAVVVVAFAAAAVFALRNYLE